MKSDIQYGDTKSSELLKWFIENGVFSKERTDASINSAELWSTFDLEASSPSAARLLGQGIRGTDTSINKWLNLFDFDSPDDTLTTSLSCEPISLTYVPGWEDDSSSENDSNFRRLRWLKNEFSVELIQALRTDAPEPGVIGLADEIVSKNLKINELATISWLNDLYLRYLNNPPVAADILLLVGRLPYEVANPTGVTMAVGGLANRNPSVVESAIRAFENWSNAESLSVLDAVKIAIDDQWVVDYLEEVKDDLGYELCHA